MPIRRNSVGVRRGPSSAATQSSATLPRWSPAHPNPSSAITDKHGLVFVYEHSDDEPEETLVPAIVMATSVAAEQAVEEAKTFVIASTTVPSHTVFMLSFGHPLSALSIMNQLMPDGQRVRSRKQQKH
jgi:hypothetical protein